MNEEVFKSTDHLLACAGADGGPLLHSHTAVDTPESLSSHVARTVRAPTCLNAEKVKQPCSIEE